jgi:hypothetical protein
MRTLLAVIPALGLCASMTSAQTNTGRGQAVPATTAQKKTQPEAVKPAPLSDSFILPATRAFTAIKETPEDALAEEGGALSNYSIITMIGDRISDARLDASTPADKAFVVAIRDYRERKTVDSTIYIMAKRLAEMQARNAAIVPNPDVPYWKCAPLEDYDSCPSFQAAVKTLLGADRELAKLRSNLKDCEDSLASALKAKRFASAPACSDSSKSESK